MDRFQDRATKYFRSAAVKWWWNEPPPSASASGGDDTNLLMPNVPLYDSYGHLCQSSLNVVTSTSTSSSSTVSTSTSNSVDNSHQLQALSHCLQAPNLHHYHHRHHHQQHQNPNSQRQAYSNSLFVSQMVPTSDYQYGNGVGGDVSLRPARTSRTNITNKGNIDSRQTLQSRRKRSKRHYRRRTSKTDLSKMIDNRSSPSLTASEEDSNDALVVHVSGQTATTVAEHEKETFFDKANYSKDFRFDAEQQQQQQQDHNDSDHECVFRKLSDEPEHVNLTLIKAEPMLLEPNTITDRRLLSFDEEDDFEDDVLQGDDEADAGVEELSEEDHEKRIALRRKLYSKHIFGTVQLDGFGSRFGQYRPYLHSYGRQRYGQRPPNIERSNTEPSSQTVHQSFAPLSPSSVSPSSTGYSGDRCAGCGTDGDGLSHVTSHHTIGHNHQYGTSSSASSLLLMMNSSQHQLSSPSTVDGGVYSQLGALKLERRNDSTSSMSSGGNSSPYLKPHITAPTLSSSSPTQRYLPQPKLSQVSRNKQIYSSHSVDECSSTGLVEPELISLMNRTSLDNVAGSGGEHQAQIKSTYIGSYEPPPTRTIYASSEGTNKSSVSPINQTYRKRYPLVQSSFSVDVSSLDRSSLMPPSNRAGGGSPSPTAYLDSRRSPVYSIDQSTPPPPQSTTTNIDSSAQHRHQQQHRSMVSSSRSQNLSEYSSVYQPNANSHSTSPVDKDDDGPGDPGGGVSNYHGPQLSPSSSYQQMGCGGHYSGPRLASRHRRQLPTIKSLPLITANTNSMSLSTASTPMVTATTTSCASNTTTSFYHGSSFKHRSGRYSVYHRSPQQHQPKPTNTTNYMTNRNNLSIPSLRLTHSFDDSSSEPFCTDLSGDVSPTPAPPLPPSSTSHPATLDRRHVRGHLHAPVRTQQHRLHDTRKQYSLDYSDVYHLSPYGSISSVGLSLCQDLNVVTNNSGGGGVGSSGPWRKLTPEPQTTYWSGSSATQTHHQHHHHHHHQYSSNSKSPVNNYQTQPAYHQVSPAPPSPPQPAPSTQYQQQTSQHQHRVTHSTSVHQQRKLPIPFNAAYLWRYPFGFFSILKFFFLPKNKLIPYRWHT